MRKHIPTYEGLAGISQTEKPNLLQRIAYWVRDFLENAE